MGRYLNARTREDVVIIAGVVGIFDQITTRWKENMKKPPKEFLEYVKASKRFAERAIRELDKELDTYEQDRLLRMAETTTFAVNYVDHGLSSKTPNIITYDITEDERDSIVESLFEVQCSCCDGKKKDCTVRGQFFKWDVTPIHEATDEIHPCQYMSPEVI